MLFRHDVILPLDQVDPSVTEGKRGAAFNVLGDYLSPSSERNRSPGLEVVSRKPQLACGKPIRCMLRNSK